MLTTKLLWAGLGFLLGTIYVVSWSEKLRYRFLIMHFIGPAAGFCCVALVAVNALIMLFQGEFFGLLLAVCFGILLFFFCLASWEKARSEYEYIYTERKRRIEEKVRNMLYYWPTDALIWVRQQWRRRSRIRKALAEAETEEKKKA